MVWEESERKRRGEKVGVTKEESGKSGEILLNQRDYFNCHPHSQPEKVGDEKSTSKKHANKGKQSYR